MKKRVFENAEIEIIETAQTLFTSRDIIYGDMDDGEWDNPGLID